MTDRPDTKALRRLGRAVDAFLAHRAQGGDQADLLARNPDVRDLLEPLLRGAGDGDGRGAEVDREARYVGGFRLLREIGRGGMGVVYEAEEIALGRRVALKVLPNQPTLTARHIERFRREAAAAGRLKHPGIVPVYSVGEIDGTHYFAMEYVEGRSLGQVLAELRGRASHGSGLFDRPQLGNIAGATSYVQEIVEVVAQAADAVAVAHSNGVLHRDVKPHNILIDTAGRVRVVDFGLAKDLARGSVSRSGEVAGTPHYMSPEQALGGRNVDARTDVYALGVVLYEALTLRVPFDADTPHHVLHAILTQEPEAPRRINLRVDRDLETICLKAMERDLRYRYRNAAELAAELRRCQRHEPIQARPPGSVTRLMKLVRRRRAATVAALLGFVLLVVGPLAFALYQQSVHATLAAQEQATAQERDRARTNFARARRLLEQQLDRLEKLGRQPGMETLHQQMAEDTLGYYQEFLGRGRSGGEDAELEREALSTHVLVGRIHLRLGDYARALAVLETAVTETERAREHASESVELAMLQVDALRHRATARRGCGDVAGGDRDRSAGVVLCEETLTRAREPGARRTVQIALAKTLFDGACDALQDGAGSAGAEAALDRAVQLMTDPALGELTEAERGGVAEMQLRRGELLRRIDRVAEAEAAIAEALRIVRGRAAAVPEDPDRQSSLAKTLGEHGSVLFALRRNAEATAAYREAIALREKLVESFPRTQDHRHGLEVLLCNLGLLMHSTGQHDEAHQLVQRATTLVEDLFRESPDSAVYATRVCNVANLLCLIECKVLKDDPDALHACYRKAIARHEAIIAQHPGITALHSTLGAMLSNHGQWLLGMGKPGMALPLLQRAIEAQRKALAADPRVAQYRLFLHIHYRTLADCHLARRELAEAAAASAACAEAQPERAGLLVVAAERMVRCAELAAAGGDAGARKPYEDAALAYLERAVQSDPAQATVIAADKVLAPLQRRPEFAALTSAPASGTAADAATAGK